MYRTQGWVRRFRNDVDPDTRGGSPDTARRVHRPAHTHTQPTVRYPGGAAGAAGPRVEERPSKHHGGEPTPEPPPCREVRRRVPGIIATHAFRCTCISCWHARVASALRRPSPGRPRRLPPPQSLGVMASKATHTAVMLSALSPKISQLIRRVSATRPES